MTSNPQPSGPPALADLFAQYLKRQTEANAVGLGYAEAMGDVEPYDAVPVQPVDPRLAWSDAGAAATHFGKAAEWSAPPEWPALVAALEPAVAVPFCLGNFPQLVRNLQPLLSGLEATFRAPTRPVPAGSLPVWAARQRGCPQTLLAAGVLRLARQFDEAEAALSKETPPTGWRAAHANEMAGLAWQRGAFEDARKAWMMQAESVPVLFNRGMAALFLDRAGDSRAPLERAVAGLPDTSAWHHLGRLYLTLAAA